MSFDDLTPEQMRQQLHQQAETIRRLEAELDAERQKSEAYRYEAQLLQFVLDPIISSDDEFNLVYWNHAAEDLYGWTREEALGKNAPTLLRTNYPDGLSRQEAKKQFMQDGVWEGEMIHHHKDGIPIRITGKTALIQDDDNNLIGYVTVLRDMTEKVAADNALRESEQRYRIISELTSDYAYLYMLDEDGNWEREWITTQSYERITGYGHERVQGKYGLFHPDEIERVEVDVARTLAGENTEGAYRILTKDGKQKWVYIIRRALWDDAHERVIGFYGAGRDITARKETEEALLEYRREQEQVQILQTFLQNASHDLKTPLSTINTSIYLLRRYATDDKQLRQINKLEQHVKRFTTLIDDMFDMSRLDLTTTLYLERVNLTLYLKDLVRRFMPKATSKEINIVTDLAPDIPDVALDINSINQAIGNVIENAIHYTPTQGTVTIRTEQEAEHVMIQIIDTGIGIAEDELPHIFDRFYRADKSRTSDDAASTGLGLSITKKVFELHHGTVTVESQVEHGTTVTLTLPLS